MNLRGTYNKFLFLILQQPSYMDEHKIVKCHENFELNEGQECINGKITKDKITNKTITADLHENIEILAIQNDQEYTAMLDKQSKMLNDAKKQRNLKEKREKEMFKIQKNLREKLLETNDFIRQCEHKRLEAEKQIQNEKSIQKQTQNEVAKYKKDIAELEEFKIVLQETVKELEPYEIVMEEVVKELDIVKSVKECMVRCDALMLAQDEIAELEKSKINGIEYMRNEMIRATNEASLTVLGLNNELAQLEHLYNAARTECMKWEKILASTKDIIINNEMKTSLCINSINQMYRLLCKRNGWSDKCNQNDVDKQLDLIKSEIEILQKVVQLCENEK